MVLVLLCAIGVAVNKRVEMSTLKFVGNKAQNSVSAIMFGRERFGEEFSCNL